MANFVFRWRDRPRPIAGRPADDPFCQKQYSKSVSSDVHDPDGPVFSGAKCPRAKDDHEVDEDFGQFIRQFVKLGLTCFLSKFSWRHLIGFGEVIRFCGFEEVFSFFV